MNAVKVTPEGADSSVKNSQRPEKHRDYYRRPNLEELKARKDSSKVTRQSLFGNTSGEHRFS